MLRITACIASLAGALFLAAPAAAAPGGNGGPTGSSSISLVQPTRSRPPRLRDRLWRCRDVRRGDERVHASVREPEVLPGPRARRRGLGRLLRRSAGRPALRSVLAHLDRRRRRLHRRARHFRERPLAAARLDELPRRPRSDARNERGPRQGGGLSASTGSSYRPLREVDTRAVVVGVGDVEVLRVANAPTASMGGVGQPRVCRSPSTSAVRPCCPRRRCSACDLVVGHARAVIVRAHLGARSAARHADRLGVHRGAGAGVVREQLEQHAATGGEVPRRRGHSRRVVREPALPRLDVRRDLLRRSPSRWPAGSRTPIAAIPSVFGESPLYDATNTYWPGAVGVNSSALPAPP